MSKSLTITITLPSDPENQVPHTTLTGDDIETAEEIMALATTLYSTANKLLTTVTDPEAANRLMPLVHETATEKTQITNP